MKTIKCIFAFLIALTLLEGCKKDEEMIPQPQDEFGIIDEHSDGSKTPPVFDPANVTTVDLGQILREKAIGLRSSAPFTLVEETYTIERGKWRKFVYNLQNSEAQHKFTAIVTPQSGDPDLYIKVTNSGGTQQTLRRSINYDLDIDQGYFSMSELENNRDIGFYIYGYKASTYKIKIVRENEATLKSERLPEKIYNYVFDNVNDQNAHINLKVNGTLFHYTDGARQKGVRLSMKESIASATDDGQMYQDTKRDRGYYLESIQVSIKPISGAQHVYFAADSPKTDTQSGQRSITSSVDVSAEFNSSGGALGGGIGTSTTWSQDFTDYAYFNRSDGTNELKHFIKMSSSSIGPYSTPHDLIDLSAGGQFSGTPLGTVPYQAKNNMPIMAQGLWKTHDPNFKGTVTFEARVDMTLQHMHVDNHFFSYDWKSNSKSRYAYVRYVVDFSKV